jgi:sulfur relay (sulfurtransferase) complex TusBCD TusD component (DsrE family)
MKLQFACLAIVLTSFFLGCNQDSATATKSSAPDIVFISVVSDPHTDPQAVDMAMKFAGFALDEGREAVMFFNVEAVTCPKTDFPNDFAFMDNDSIKSQLTKLIERGADIHVCPICMKALGIEASDLMEGAKVTTRPSLFAKIGQGTVAITY